MYSGNFKSHHVSVCGTANGSEEGGVPKAGVERVEAITVRRRLALQAQNRLRTEQQRLSYGVGKMILAADPDGLSSIPRTLSCKLSSDL